MKNLKFLLLLVFAISFSSFYTPAPGEWQMTDGYSVRFKTKKVSGFFHNMKGKIVFDERNLNSASFKMEIDVASITTGNSLKSWHAKKAKWFDAKQYPQITFVSNKVQKTDKGYQVNGKLKLKDVEKDVSIPFSFISKVFTGHFKLLRSDFHVGKTKGMSKMVGDTIQIDITVPVTN